SSFFSCYHGRPALHSFPTRRSSDLFGGFLDFFGPRHHEVGDQNVGMGNPGRESQFNGLVGFGGACRHGKSGQSGSQQAKNPSFLHEEIPSWVVGSGQQVWASKARARSIKVSTSPSWYMPSRAAVEVAKGGHWANCFSG